MKRIKHHSRGYADLIKETAVVADLRERSGRIAEACGGADEAYYAESSTPRRRARAAVVAPLGDPENRMIRHLDAGR